MNIEANEGAAEAVTEVDPIDQANPADGQAQAQGDEQSGDDAAAATDGEDGEEGESQPEPKPRKSAQERINEQTRARREAEREAAHWRRIAQEGAAPQPKPEPAKTDAEPDPQDFEYGETDPGFIRALAKFEARQEYRAEAQRHQRETARRNVEQTFEEREREFVKQAPEYQKLVIEGGDDWVCTPPMADAIRTSDDGPAVALYLAKNPDEARRIAGMNTLSQVKAIGRLEERLAKPSASIPKPKTVSDAPAPHPQARGAGGQFRPGADTTDFAAFERLADGKG